LKIRPRRADAELEASAKDVTYEIQMMIEAGELLAFGMWGSPATTLADTEENMALECFLLHYRNLRAFLCPSLQGEAREDDVIAADFLHKTTADDVGDASKIGADKARLDKMLAHISYSRRREFIGKCNTGWHVGEMATAMLSQIDVFLATIPEHMRVWLPDRSKLAEARELIERNAHRVSAFTHTISGPFVITVTRPRKTGF